jgi:hypothetical protein
MRASGSACGPDRLIRGLVPISARAEVVTQRICPHSERSVPEGRFAAQKLQRPVETAGSKKE